MKSYLRNAVFAAAMTCAGTIGVRADAVLTTAATRTMPRAIAIDSVTNKIYVADDSFVTVIDGATNSTTNLGVGIGGSSSYSIAVNPVTNMVYVANKNSNSVTVINGATGSTVATVATTIGVGTSPVALAVNPVTNMIYVANYGSNNVTAINGANNFASTVTVGTEPVAIAVNTVTDIIYVANYGGAITLINGSNATATLTGGNGARCDSGQYRHRYYLCGELRRRHHPDQWIERDGHPDRGLRAVCGSGKPGDQ